MSKSWRKKLIDSGLQLTDTQVKVLKYGPKGKTQTNVLQRMKRLFREKIETIRKV